VPRLAFKLQTTASMAITIFKVVASGLALILFSIQSLAQVKDLDASIQDRLIVERNHETGFNTYYWCTLMPPRKADSTDPLPIGKIINYRGNDFVCPMSGRLGCRTQDYDPSAYHDVELIAYQRWLKLKQVGIVALDAVVVAALVGPTVFNSAAIGAFFGGLNLSKGLGLIASVNIAGWTLTQFITPITTRMDPRPYSRAVKAIALAWDLNPAPGVSTRERLASIKESRDILNKTLCDLDKWKEDHSDLAQKYMESAKLSLIQ
jgi:hypothetical protein